MDGEGLDIPLARDPGASLRVDLESREADFLQRLDGELERSRWQLERLENRRRSVEERERSTAARLSVLRRMGAPARRDVLARQLASYRELDELLHQTEETIDIYIRSLQAAANEARRLGLDLDPAGQQRPTSSAAIDEAVDSIAVSIQQAERRRDKLVGTYNLLTESYQDRRQSLSSARARLLHGELHGHDLAVDGESEGPTDPGATADAGAADSEAPMLEPPSPEEQELLELNGTLARLQVRVLESHSEVDRVQLELLALDVQREEMKLPVLAYRQDQLESLRDDVASREQGGLLNVSPGLLDPSALRSALKHTRTLVADPRRSLAGVGERMTYSPEQIGGQSPAAIMLGLALLGLLAFVLVRRVTPVLRLLQPESRVDAVVLAIVFGSLPFLPLSLICGTLAVIDLVPESLTPLYRFSAIAPPVAASVLAVADVLFPATERDGARQSVALYIRRLVRLGTALACLVLGISVLLPLLGYPEEVRGLVRAGLMLWLLVGWLGVALRRKELLTFLGADGDRKEVGLVRVGVRRFYRVLVIGPVVLYALYATGYNNLAIFLVRGGAFSFVVLLLAPWAHLRLRELAERLLGYPHGGGLLALSPAGARTAYRTIAPLILLCIGGASFTLLASGWGYGHLVGNISSAVSYPLLDVGGSSISAGSIFLFALTIAATYLLSRWVLSMLQQHLYPLYDLDRGMRTTLDTLIRYAIFVTGVVVGLDVVGVGIGFLTVFAGVVGIGIGFGSQTLAHNFISGLILLVTRPAAVDDVIEVEGIIGRVVRISSYATVVRTLDNLLVIVPNSRILDGRLVNWTVGDKRVRLAVQVGVAYGSDVGMVKKLLLEVAEEHPRVLRYPAPIVRFDDFADSSLAFTLLPWTDDPDNRFVVASDLRFKVDEAFRTAKIEIAFPQQDVHLRTSDGVIKVALDKGFEVRDEDGETLVHADLGRQRARSSGS